MEVTLEEAKTYLRVSTGDEDSLIESLISAATKQVQDITRQSDEEFMANEEKALIRIRVAVLYTVGYLYEHREEADHHALTMTLALSSLWHTGRSVLMNIAAMRCASPFRRMRSPSISTETTKTAGRITSPAGRP
jgi:uncharacterized phage protein (predicted DNA packaging)